MIEYVRKEFIQYAKKFDLKDKHIMEKFHHSFRVMELAKEIALSLQLAEEDIELATTIGLLHDIGRFEQWTNYQTYVDSKSVDHGDLGSSILTSDAFIQRLVEGKEEQRIILIAVRNHNKYQIEENLSERELLMAKIIRDADKLDIMKEQGKITKPIDWINPELWKVFETKELCQNHKVDQKEQKVQEVDHILRMLSFIYDIYFSYTYHYLLDHHIIENKIHLLRCYYDDQTLLDDLENTILTDIKERCE